jgi:hypothetical protein
MLPEIMNLNEFEVGVSGTHRNREVFLCRKGVTVQEAMDYGDTFIMVLLQSGYRASVWVMRGELPLVSTWDWDDDKRIQQLINMACRINTDLHDTETTFINTTGPNPVVSYTTEGGGAA